MIFLPCGISRRRGFALPLMLAVLAVGSILIAAAFLMARLEVQSGENGLNAARAREAAESGLSEIVAWWDPAQYNQLAAGDTLSLPTRTMAKGGYDGHLTRLGPALYLVEARGWYQAATNLPVARRTLWSIARLEQETPAIGAALTVVDSIGWDAGSLVAGGDTIPPGWGGACNLDSALAGLRTAPGTYSAPGGCTGCFTGMPPATADSTVNLLTLTGFGTGGYAGLAGRAAYAPAGISGSISPQVGGTPAVCLVSDSLNWGEPRRSGPFAACRGHHPVVHSPGNLTLTGGRGQGVLLVDGDLELGGGVEFLGLVIVLGTIRNGPGGGTILGALLARNILLDGSLPGSRVHIHYSACVLPTATRGSSQAIPLPYRHWVQRF